MDLSNGDRNTENAHRQVYCSKIYIIIQISLIHIFIRYYELDDLVIREILGKKLSSRHRKDLDEVSEKTSVSLKSCRRQFDNVRRIHKAVEEMQGHIVNNIETNFLLSTDLSKYSEPSCL